MSYSIPCWIGAGEEQHHASHSSLSQIPFLTFPLSTPVLLLAPPHWRVTLHHSLLPERLSGTGLTRLSHISTGNPWQLAQNAAETSRPPWNGRPPLVDCTALSGGKHTRSLSSVKAQSLLLCCPGTGETEPSADDFSFSHPHTSPAAWSRMSFFICRH